MGKNLPEKTRKGEITSASGMHEWRVFINMSECTFTVAQSSQGDVIDLMGCTEQSVQET